MKDPMLSSARRRLELEQRYFPVSVTPEVVKLLDDVQELLSRAYQAGQQEGRSARQEWSNQSAFGYTIMAAEQAGLDIDQIHSLVHALHNRFDFKTLGEAAEFYRNSPY